MKSKKILVIAPHPDDETLGAGGAIAKYADQGHEVHVLLVSGHLPPLYTREAFEKTVLEFHNAGKILGIHDSKFLEIPATMVKDTPTHILNSLIAQSVEDIKPDIVLCPYPDRHIDHRVVFDAAMVATRPVGVGKNIEIVAAYETLSETHWNAPHIEPNFTPNWVIDISKHFETKLNALKCFESQIGEFPNSRSIEAIKALSIFRGTQAGFGYGEAFHIIRKIS